MLRGDLTNAALITAAFLSLIALAEIWHRWKSPKVEWTRKLVHLGGGAVCLSLPFAIHSHWVVLAMAVSMAVLFLVTKRLGWLRSIHGIQRPSLGSEYYPIVIYFLFLLTPGAPWKYVICVLVLAVADSAAAIIGTKFGRLRFLVEDETKSLEGSIAFFVVTLAAVVIPLVIWNPLGDPHQYPLAQSGQPAVHYMLASMLIGFLVTCFEVVSLRGTDNLWVPLGTLLVLSKTMQTDVADLTIQNISFLAILVTMIGVAHMSHLLNLGGAIICCLACYGLWAMGSFDWAIVFFIALGAYLLAAFIADTPWQIRVRPAAYSLVPPILVLGAANLALNTGRADLYQFSFGPFLAASCVALSQVVVNVLVWRWRKRFVIRIWLAAVVSIVLTVAIVSTSMWRQDTWSFPTMIALCGIVVLFSVVSALAMTPLPPGRAPKAWLLSRAALSVAAALIAIVVQAAWLGSIWYPV